MKDVMVHPGRRPEDVRIGATREADDLMMGCDHEFIAVMDPETCSFWWERDVATFVCIYCKGHILCDVEEKEKEVVKI